MKSCETCPSFVPASEVAVVFGRSTGTAMCGRFGYVLGRPGLSEAGEETARVAFAMKCDAYGEERPSKPLSVQSRVTNADPAVVEETGAPEFVSDDLTSCRQCKFSVRSDAVAAELGYPLDMCSAKGKIILRPQNECRSCPMAKFGDQRTSTDGLEIRAEFREGFRIDSKVAADAITGIGNTTADPLAYVSDYPVSAEDRADGIIAWRKIGQPDGPGSQPLPIFDPSFFTEDERHHIPKTGDDATPELYVDYDHKLYRFAIMGYKKGFNVALQGLPGTGKTEFCRWLAWLMQVPFYRFTFKKSSEVAHILGSTQVRATDNGPETYFEMGRLPKVYDRPCVIDLDELNLAPPEITESLRSVLDTGELVLDEASPPIYKKRGSYTFILVAQNPSWDVRNRGAEELAAAEFSRLRPIAVELPPDAVERHIIQERCQVLDGYTIPESTLDVLMGVAADFRVAGEQQAVPFTWGIREQIAVARLTEDFSLPMAFKCAVLDFYEPQVVEMCLKMVSDHTG